MVVVGRLGSCRGIRRMNNRLGLDMGVGMGIGIGILVVLYHDVYLLRRS